MECPKCGYTIDEHTLVCPNCRKVLKLVCPQCKTINTSNTCKKCGFAIMTKCHKCGKMNKTINGKCSKCGFDTYVSSILNDSNIDEFACLTINFSNLENVKKALGSSRLFDKFKSKLHRLIWEYFHSLKLKPQVIDDVYVIRFNKDMTFRRSAKSSILSAMEILNSVIKVNFKLQKLKNATIACNMGIFKRDVYSIRESYKSGVNIQVVYENIEENKYLQGLQLIADQNIYEVVRNDFSLNSLGSTMVKNTSVLIFEFDLKKYLQKPEEAEDEAEKEIDMAVFQKYEPEEDEVEFDNSNNFSFDEGKASFLLSNSKSLVSKVVEVLNAKEQTILSIKSKRELLSASNSFIAQIRAMNKFDDVYCVSCSDLIRKTPYGFFKELISEVYGYSSETVDFSSIASVDKKEYIKNLIKSETIEVTNPAEKREYFLEFFKQLISSLKKSLIIIEDFDKIDDTSFEFLKDIFVEFTNYSASFLVISDKDFSLTRKVPALLQNSVYAEITVKPSPFSEFLEANKKLYKNLLDTFYLHKIAEQTKGSPLYFMLSTFYLLDCGILELENGSFQVKNNEISILPNSLDDLIKKRLQFLSKDEQIFNLLAKILFLGARLDSCLLTQLNVNLDLLKQLESMEYIYIKDGMLHVQNYSLYYDNLLEILSNKERKDIAVELLNIVPKNKFLPQRARLLAFLEPNEEMFLEWKSLIDFALSLGDFYAYFNIGMELIQLFNNSYDELENEFVEEFKCEFFDNVTKYLYNYNSKENQVVISTLIQYLEMSGNSEKIVQLCEKLLYSSIREGQYSEALIFLYKIFSNLSSSIIDVKNSRFNKKAFYLSVIKCDILFNLGNLKECYNLAIELFMTLKNTDYVALKPDDIEESMFSEKIYVMLQYAILAGIMLLDKNVTDFIVDVKNYLSLSDSFVKVMNGVNNYLHANEFKVEVANVINERFTSVISLVLDALSFVKSDLNTFIQQIYRAKILARMYNLRVFELFADTMIAYSYFKSGNLPKAKKIYKSVLDEALENGLKNNVYLAWYFISELNIAEKNYAVADGLINNVIIQLERDENSSDFVLMHFKLLLAKLSELTGETEQAEFCMNRALLIANSNDITISQ